MVTRRFTVGPRAAPHPRHLARRGQRGAALFIVVLVTALLLGIGMFAARTAHLAIAASGGARQSLQAHYVAEYASLIAESKLASGGAQAYLRAMSSPVDVCFGQVAATPGRSCYKMLYQDIQAELQANGGWNVCDPPQNAAVPGSLGPMDGPTAMYSTCDFSVELTDLSDATPTSGFGKSKQGPNTAPQKFYYVTSTATGSVGLPPVVNAPAANYSVGSSQTRSRILVGPVSFTP